MLNAVNTFDNTYHAMLRKILNRGVRKEDRTGTGTMSIFGHMCRFDLSEGFPLITTKKIHLKSVIHELLWMLSGSSNVKYLQENDVTIWNEWADKDGNLGPVYGAQWRKWPKYRQRLGGAICDGEVDQIAEIVDKLRNNPWDRRIMLNAWNVAEIPNMALPPCHFNAQFNVTPPNPVRGLDPDEDDVPSKPVDRPARLNCLMNIRSWDTFLGGPFNIAQYALLTMMLAQVSNLDPGELCICSGDTHLYLNHIEQAKLQITRNPYPAPKMIIDPSVKEIGDFRYDSFKIEGYVHHPHIKGAVSV